MDLEDVQAEEQVVTETALGHTARQVLVRRAEDADVERLWLSGADRQHLVLLQHTQQLDLHWQRDVGQFVKEDCAAVSQGEQAGARLRRAGECAAHMAEQLAFDEVRIEAADVNGQERPIAARAEAMNGTGDEFLAGAALAGDQHARLARRHQGDALEHRLHRRTAADNFVLRGKPRLWSRGVGRRGPIERTVQGIQCLTQVERLRQIVERAAFDGLDCRRQIAERGDDQDRHVGRRFVQPSQRRQTVHAGQAHVENDCIRPLLFGEG